MRSTLRRRRLSQNRDLNRRFPESYRDAGISEDQVIGERPQRFDPRYYERIDRSGPPQKPQYADIMSIYMF